MKDNYNHMCPPLHRVAMGNNLDIHKETSNGTLYYVHTKRQAIISAFCVVGNCPTPTTTTMKKRGNEMEMYFIRS